MAESASNEIVIRAVRAICEFSSLVSQQNHSDLPLKALDNTLKQFDQKKGIFRERNMSQSAKAKVADLLAMGFYQLRKQYIHKIRAATEALVYGAGKVSSTQCRQFQVYRNSAR